MILAMTFNDVALCIVLVVIILPALAARGLFKLASDDGTAEGGMRKAARKLTDEATKQDAAGRVAKALLGRFLGK